VSRLLAIFVLVSMCLPAFAETPDIQVALQEWQNQDRALGVPPQHLRRWILPEEDFHSQQDVSILMLHGLYESPQWMMGMADILSKQTSSPILVSRLPGHFEADPKSLDKVKWDQWLQSAEKDFALARRLGRKVLLVGNSTGSLLVTWLAAKYPDSVEGLILFVPAFGVTGLTQAGAQGLRLIGVHPVKGGKVLSGPAGIEVVKAAQAFKQWVAGQGGQQMLSERLSTVPLWTANTVLDTVIQKSEVRAFLKPLKEFNPQRLPRTEFWVPSSELVAHDTIMAPNNSQFASMKRSLLEFVAALK
jgi:pimeloyl-ACP methyl ester carboxylesterase